MKNYLPLKLKKFLAVCILGYGIFFVCNNAVNFANAYSDVHPNRQVIVIQRP